jgi:hypothetical protein
MKNSSYEAISEVFCHIFNLKTTLAWYHWNETQTNGFHTVHQTKTPMHLAHTSWGGGGTHSPLLPHVSAVRGRHTHWTAGYVLERLAATQQRHPDHSSHTRQVICPRTQTSRPTPCNSRPSTSIWAGRTFESKRNTARQWSLPLLACGSRIYLAAFYQLHDHFWRKTGYVIRRYSKIRHERCRKWRLQQVVSCCRRNVFSEPCLTIGSIHIQTHRQLWDLRNTPFRFHEVPGLGIKMLIMGIRRYTDTTEGKVTS